MPITINVAAIDVRLPDSTPFVVTLATTLQNNTPLDLKQGHALLFLAEPATLRVPMPLLSNSNGIMRDIVVVTDCNADLCIGTTYTAGGNPDCSIGHARGRASGILEAPYIDAVYVTVQNEDATLCSVTAEHQLSLWPEGRTTKVARANCSFTLESEPVWFNFQLDSVEATSLVAFFSYDRSVVSLFAAPMPGDAPLALYTPSYAATSQRHSALVMASEDIRMMGEDHGALSVWLTGTDGPLVTAIFEAGVPHTAIDSGSFGAHLCTGQCAYIVRGQGTVGLSLSRCERGVSLLLSDTDPTPTLQTAQAVLTDNTTVTVEGALALVFDGRGILLVNEALGARPVLTQSDVSATVSHNGTLTARFAAAECTDCTPFYSLFFVFNSSYTEPLTPCGVSLMGMHVFNWTRADDLQRDEEGHLMISVPAQMDNNLPRVAVVVSAPPVAEPMEEDFVTHAVMYTLAQSSVVETANSIYLALGIVGGAVIVAIIFILTTVACSVAKRHGAAPETEMADSAQEPKPMPSDDSNTEIAVIEGCADVVVDPLAPLSVLAHQAKIDPEAMFWHRAVSLVIGDRSEDHSDPSSLEG